MLYSNAIGSKWGDTLPDTGFGLYSWWKGPTAWKGKAVCPELDLCACDQARMLERGAVSFLPPFWLVSWGLRLTEFQRLTQWQSQPGEKQLPQDSCTLSSAPFRSSFMGDARYEAHSIWATPARGCAGGGLGGSLSSTRSRLKVWGQAPSLVLWFRPTFRIQIWVQNEYLRLNIVEILHKELKLKKITWRDHLLWSAGLLVGLQRLLCTRSI